MSRHNRGGDPDFGSDSFLDIIANIVGILIILIVVAGVKVARQPLLSPEPPPPVVTESVPDDGVPLEDLYRLNEQIAKQQRMRSTADDTLESIRIQSQQVSHQAADLQTEIDRADADVVEHDRDVSATEQKLSELADDALAVTAEIGTLERGAIDTSEREASIRAILNHVYDRQKTSNEELGRIRIQTAQLTELLDNQQPPLPMQVQLQHRLSPVSRSVSQEELHFRLTDGRIAWIPIEPLLERLKTQVLRRGNVIRRFGQYEGSCGPVGGFLMKYSVQRAVPSPLNALNGVQSGMSIEVSKWTIVPSANLHAETVAEALISGSRYRQIVEAADYDATITIWLYPDDFEYFRDLRELAHQLDLRVAARPLPYGTDITGSPGGSRSSAQ